MATVDGDVVTLSEADIERSRWVGQKRQQESLKKGLSQTGAYGTAKPGPELLEMEILGAMGECAFAAYRGVPWAGHVNEWKKADVDGHEVRATARLGGRLIFRDNDIRKAYRPFVLMVGRCPIFRCAGWILGSEIQRDDWYGELAKGKPKCWSAPQIALAHFLPAPPGSNRRMLRDVEFDDDRFKDGRPGEGGLPAAEPGCA